MLEMKKHTYVEETNELIDYNHEWEGKFICLGRQKSRYDVIRAFNSECCICCKLVKQTADAQEDLDYWLSHLDEYIKLHQHSFDSGDMDINHPIRETLSYFITTVQLIEDGKVIKEETYRYGH